MSLHQVYGQFNKNRRAVWSLRVLVGLVLLVIIAPLVANDRPLLVIVKQRVYVPILFDYPETTFDGYFKTTTYYRGDYFKDFAAKNKATVVWPLIPYSDQTHDFNLTESLPAPPSMAHWLGTDDQGKDMVAGLIYGLRISMGFSLVLTVFSICIGVVVGAVQGYYGGLVDLIGQRVLEVWSGLPTLFIIIILSSLMMPSFWTLIGIMLLFSWIGLVGRVRAEFLRERNLDYVKAAQVMGIAPMRIIMRHILPNALITTLTMIPFILTENIVALSSLDFLGFGLPTGSPSLGVLLAQAKDNLHAPWIGISVFITLAVMLSILIFIGEGLRDALDPRLNRAC